VLVISPLRALATREEGGALITVVLWLPVIVLFATLVVDVGHWFVHKRHLQMQADAGALAAGGAFSVPCSNTVVEGFARKYAGDPGAPAPYNSQIAPTDPANVHVLVNSTAYWNEGGSDYSDGGPPCTARMVDLKLTESNLPWFFGLNVVPAINAHARVEIQALNTAAGALPVGVPDVNPQVARAVFVDEANPGGPPLASVPLVNTTTANGLSIWDNSGAPVSVPISASRIGVRIVLGGASSTTCGDPLVECYDAGSALGVLFARGHSNAGSGAQPGPPIARDVMLVPGSCADPYFTSEATSCTVGVRARVDFGVANPVAPNAPGAIVRATIAGVTRPLTFDSTTGYWESSGVNFFSIAPAAGPVDVQLSWEETLGTQGGDVCKSTGGNKCTGSFGSVHRVFSAVDSRSGPIKLAQIWENGGFWANSFELGTTHDLVVRIGIKATLKNAADASDPPVYLRVAGNVNGNGNQSQNQSLDCDPGYSNLSDELANGCRPLYTKNTGTACPGGSTALWGSPQPWACVAMQTGQATNQVAQGLNRRILGSDKPTTCTSPNNWSQFPNLPAGDPRVLQVFLTPFGSFNGSGSGTVPVTNFATFYVTGWTGQGSGFNNPCQGNGDDPVPGNDAGVIVGHFIKYIFALNSGGSGELCDFSSFGSCVAVLTE
jgi:Putative Flp pilus-assembly TadE/G-like